MPAQYPLPVFHFTVQWGGTRIGFSEVTGLTQENQADLLQALTQSG